VNVISCRLFMSIFQFKLVFILLSIVWCCIFQLYWFKKRKKNYILIITSSFHMWNEFLKLNYYNFTVLRPLEVVLYSLALGDDGWINHSKRDKKLFINSKCISSGIIEYWKRLRPIIRSSFDLGPFQRYDPNSKPTSPIVLVVFIFKKTIPFIFST
jgi:hypothetical protein